MVRRTVVGIRPCPKDVRVGADFDLAAAAFVSLYAFGTLF